MTTMAIINEFLGLNNIALVGASANKKRFGHTIFKELTERGINILPVNSKYQMIGNVVCYKDLQSINHTIDGLIIATSSAKTADIVKSALTKGIKLIWFQMNSELEEALKICEENNIRYITKNCILMYLSNVHGVHKFHKTIKMIFGRLPK